MIPTACQIDNSEASFKNQYWLTNS